MVASDRISTYDVVHPTPIPDKGKVLTGLSVFWFDRTGHIVANHLVSYTEVPDEVRGRGAARRAAGDAPGRVRRARLHHRLGLEGLPARPARSAGSSCRTGCASPSSCRSRSSRRRRRPRSATTTRTSTSTAPRRSSATASCSRSCGACRSRSTSSRAEHARERGIILADTKFEFGRGADGTIVLGDEVLTPDSSRFWPADGYEPGQGQPCFDKQFVRDWASGSGWDKTPPAPAIPDDVVAGHARALRRGLRADHRRAVRRLARAQRVGGVRAPRPDPARRRASSTRRARPSSGRCRRSASRASRTSTSAGWSSSTSTRSDAAAGDVREAAREPADRGLRDPRGRREVRRRPLPRLLRRGRRRARLRAASARPRSSGTATATCRASTPSSSPAASPTATTCASARSRASRR